MLKINNKTNNKINKNIILLVTLLFLFFALVSATTVSAVDLTMNDTNIVTNTEDVNIIDQDLSNSNASVDNKNLNIKNSKLNNSKLSNNNGNVEIIDSTIKNSNLTFNNNDEIIIKNSKFFNTIISITGAKTLYLINCSFINSSVNSSTTNLLTLDLIINKTSNVNLTTDHIVGSGIVFVNDHSNLYLNVIKTRNAHEDRDYDGTYYSAAFSRAHELSGFNGLNYNRYYSYQLIMVNGSSSATGKINGTIVPWVYDFITISSSDSIDLIEGTWNITDHNNGNGIDLYASYGSYFFKLPNGTIIEIMHQMYLRFAYEGNTFGFYHFYQQIDNGIYDYYSQIIEDYYFESVNLTYQSSTYREGRHTQLLFDMLSAYNETGFTNSQGALLKNDQWNGYFIFNRYVDYNTENIKIYLNDVYNSTHKIYNVYYGDWWWNSYDNLNGFSINSFELLLEAYSGEYENYYNNTQNIFLYQNIKYVDENGTVLKSEDKNIFLSLLTYFFENQAPYSAIKSYYEKYGVDGFLMLLNVNMDDPDEVNYYKEELEELIVEINRIIDEILIDDFGFTENDFWKIIVIPSNSTIDNNQTSGNNQTTNNNQTPGNNINPDNNNGGNNQGTKNKDDNVPVVKITKKVDLAISKIKKVKSSKNKKIVTYKITIQNKGNLKSEKTTLSLWHIRINKFKSKVKIINIKSLKSGQKITLTVKFYPDNKNHKLCKEEYFVLNPSKNVKESTYKNNKKILKA